MNINLSESDLTRLKNLAQHMGVQINWHHYHGGPLIQYVLSPDGNMQAVPSDTWLVDMFEEIEKRLEKLEQKCSSLEIYG